MSGKDDLGEGATDINVIQIGSNMVRIQKSKMRDVNIYIILNLSSADQKQTPSFVANDKVLGKLLSRVKISCRGKRKKRSASGGQKFHMTLRSHYDAVKKGHTPSNGGKAKTSLYL